MNIPSSLKIELENWIIKNSPLPDVAGFTDFGKLTILLDSTLTDTQKLLTLFHEILHISNSELSEEVIDFLAHFITRLFLNNKKQFIDILK